MMEPRPISFALTDDETRHLWRWKENTEAFLYQMRQRGAWQVESIRALCKLGEMPLAEAKKIVHFSPTWADAQAAADELHQAAVDALDTLQQEEHATLLRAAS